VAGTVLKVAPETRIIAYDVFGPDGGTSSQTIADAINAVVAKQGAPYNTKAINLSLGAENHHVDERCNDPSDPVQTAFGQALAVGIQPVVSAGNDAYVNGSFVSGVSWPACAPGALAVGAVYDRNSGNHTFNPPPYRCTDRSPRKEQVACFSQGGPLVDVLAPGVDIKAAGTKLSGTSQAAPHVAGAVAVLAAADPRASINDVRSAITGSGPMITDPRTSLSHHRLDLRDALALRRRAAVISNGTVQLGVNQFANLNVPGPASAGGTRVVGLRYLPTGYEVLGPGCLCEGWGVADAAAPETAGYANEAAGTANLTLVKFSHSGRDATSVVRIGDRIEVTHDIHPNGRHLYELRVTIKNIGKTPLADLRYRRVMDWDVEPTPFKEYVTVDTGTSPAIRFASDDGFASANPLVGPSSLLFTGNAMDSGPADHGALFDLGFEALKPGKTRKFRIYYGAAPTETDANKAIHAVKAEAYSYGQPATSDGATAGKPTTFIFALRDIGGRRL